jgi:urease alpha subunit
LVILHMNSACSRVPISRANCRHTQKAKMSTGHRAGHQRGSHTLFGGGGGGGHAAVSMLCGAELLPGPHIHTTPPPQTHTHTHTHLLVMCDHHKLEVLLQAAAAGREGR